MAPEKPPSPTALLFLKPLPQLQGFKLVKMSQSWRYASGLVRILSCQGPHGARQGPPPFELCSGDETQPGEAGQIKARTRQAWFREQSQACT